MLSYSTLVLGPLETNCYILSNDYDKSCFVIDPADDGVGISEIVESRGLKPLGILLTHGHTDHVMAAVDLKLIYSIPIYCSVLDFFLLQRARETAQHFLKKKIDTPNIEKIDIDLDKIEKFKLGDETIDVLKTPGHTPGSVSFFVPSEKWLFSGDTLFSQGQRGRTDFKYASTKTIYKSLYKLMQLPKDTLVLSGHGEETTIGTESERYVFSDENKK